MVIRKGITETFWQRIPTTPVQFQEKRIKKIDQRILDNGKGRIKNN